MGVNEFIVSDAICGLAMLVCQTSFTEDAVKYINVILVLLWKSLIHNQLSCQI